MVRKAILINVTVAPKPARARLAGLPLLLRALLAAQRAGIEEVTVVGGSDPTPLLRHDRRVKLAWRWLPLNPPEDNSEINALRRAAGDWQENFLLFFADSIFDAPAASALGREPLNGPVARAGVGSPGGEGLAEASLFLCTPQFLPVLEAASVAAAGEGRIGAVVAQLRDARAVGTAEISGRVWPRTTDRKQFRRIQRELSRVSLKPSDGFYAKFNKLWLAQPLIRFFLRTPATPNFITSLGLLFGIGAGVAFSQGGYWWAVTGALMWFVSAIMDHVDGMVARLKFLESDFGTWFESWADYISTFSAYIGLTIGLYRETGFRHHLVVGGLFVFGAVMSFILQSRQRKLTSPDNPADYPNRIHRKLEENSQNLLLWFARNAYFVARRAVLPYCMLLFCLLDLRVLFLGWSTLGANVMWILTLYSNRFIRPSVPPATVEAD